MGDRGLPKSYRHMDGFGSHTYQFINAEGVRHWVKFHFKTNQGIKNLTQAEADKLAGVKVAAEVVKAAKGPKITIMKYKNKTGYRKRQGHRQPLTQIKVTKIG